MMKFFQKLGKSLMLPVACLPVCGILMGIGYALCPATMQGGDITGAKALIGFFLVKAGGGSGIYCGGLSLLNRTVPDQSRGCVDR